MVASDWWEAAKAEKWGMLSATATMGSTLVCFFVGPLALPVAAVFGGLTIFFFLGNAKDENHDATEAKTDRQEIKESVRIIRERVLVKQESEEEYDFVLSEIIRQAAVEREDLQRLMDAGDIFFVYVYVNGFPDPGDKLNWTRHYPKDLKDEWGLVRMGFISPLFAGSWSKIPDDVRSVQSLTIALEESIQNSIERDWNALSAEVKRRRLKSYEEFENKDWRTRVRASVLVVLADRSRMGLGTVEKSTLPPEFYGLLGDSLTRRGELTKILPPVKIREIVDQASLESLFPTLSADKAELLRQHNRAILNRLGVKTIYMIADVDEERIADALKIIWKRDYQKRAVEMKWRSESFRKALQKIGV